jgi:hypothetical protein
MRISPTTRPFRVPVGRMGSQKRERQIAISETEKNGGWNATFFSRSAKHEVQGSSPPCPTFAGWVFGDLTLLARPARPVAGRQLTRAGHKGRRKAAVEG